MMTSGNGKFLLIKTLCNWVGIEPVAVESNPTPAVHTPK